MNYEKHEMKMIIFEHDTSVDCATSMGGGGSIFSNDPVVSDK